MKLRAWVAKLLKLILWINATLKAFFQVKTLNVVFVIVCANVSGPVLYMFKAAGRISPIFAVCLIGAGFEIVTVCVRKIGLDTHQGVDLSPSWLAQYFHKRLVSMCSTKEIEILTWSKSQYVFINKSWLFSNSSEHSTWVCDWSTNNFHYSLNIHWLSGSLHSNPFVAKLISRA